MANVTRKVGEAACSKLGKECSGIVFTGTAKHRGDTAWSTVKGYAYMWKCDANCKDGPFNAGAYDYYHKCDTETKEEIVVGKYAKKYTKKWPHCLNLGACFGATTTLLKAEALCNAQ